jgi:hypothetical protein
VTRELRSGNGRNVLSIQDDGNLVQYHDGTPVWATNKHLMPLPMPPPQQGVPRLRVSPGKRLLQTDAGAWDGREATFMAGYSLWLQGRQDEMDVAIERLKRHGKITSVRSLLNLGSEFWESRGLANSFAEPAFYPSLVPFAEWLASHGLYWHVCLFGGVESCGAEPDWVRRGDVVTGHPDVIQRMHAYLDQAVGTLREQPNVFFQIANEPNQIGFGRNSQVVVELGQHAKELVAGDVPLDLGAQDEDQWDFAAPPANAFAYHLSRKPEWDHFASVKRLIHGDADAWSRPVYDDEPFNMGYEKERSTATAFCLGAMNRLKHVAIATFHARELLWCQLEHPDTVACLKAWSRGLDAIPLGVPGLGCNGHWECSPVADGSFPPTEDASDDWDGPVRVYGRRDGDRWIGVSIREPQDYTMRWKGETPHVVDSETFREWKAAVYEV